jgi:hypothetical protein
VIQFRKIGSVTVVDLQRADVADLVTSLRLPLDTGDRRILIDLKKVKILRAEGLEKLIAAQLACEEAGGIMGLFHLSRDLDGLIRIMELDRFFPYIFQDEKEAVSQFGRIDLETAIKASAPPSELQIVFEDSLSIAELTEGSLLHAERTAEVHSGGIGVEEESAPATLEIESLGIETVGPVPEPEPAPAEEIILEPEPAPAQKTGKTSIGTEGFAQEPNEAEEPAQHAMPVVEEVEGPLEAKEPSSQEITVEMAGRTSSGEEGLEEEEEEKIVAEEIPDLEPPPP